MALALYRRYRPATFAEVVGQEHVTEPLRTALAAGRVNHAYLFSGPRGCGKTSSARILARSLNCADGPTPDPCGVCDSCVALAPEGPGSIDVLELDAASHNGVDDARELRDRAIYAPASSRYRVFIVDEAHMVTTQGFNALLKIVEEPPEHLVFVFATTEPDKVLPTIRSRTHHYPFRLLAPGTLRRLLERICAAEGVAVEAAVYPLVMRAAGGSARDALSVLDQLLAGAGPEGVTYARAVPLLGVTDAAILDDVVDALAASDGAAVFQAVDELVEAGHDPRRFASDLLQRLRDLVLLQAVPDAAERALVDGPGDALDRMADQAKRLGPAALARYAEVVHNGLVEMRGATAPRLLLELLCARMLLPAASTADAALVQRLERVERRMTITPAVAPPPTVSAPPPAVVQRPTVSAPEVRVPEMPVPEVPVPEPERAASAVTGEVDATAVRRVWPEVLREVQDRSRTIKVLLTGAGVAAVDGDGLLLCHESEPLARRLSDERNAQVIADALRAVLGVNWRVRCQPAGGAPGPGGTAVTSAPPPRTRRPAPVTAVPRPDEPPAAGPLPDEEEERMLAEATASGPPAERRDPEEVAMELLTQHLGARPLDGGRTGG